MLYKKFGGDNFAAQMVGEAKLRQLKQVDAPYLSASGPGFVARKRGVTNEVWLDDPPPELPHSAIQYAVIGSNEYSFASATLNTKFKEKGLWTGEYIGRGKTATSVLPQVRIWDRATTTFPMYTSAKPGALYFRKLFKPDIEGGVYVQEDTRIITRSQYPWDVTQGNYGDPPIPAGSSVGWQDGMDVRGTFYPTFWSGRTAFVGWVSGWQVYATPNVVWDGTADGNSMYRGKAVIDLTIYRDRGDGEVFQERVELQFPAGTNNANEVPGTITVLSPGVFVVLAGQSLLNAGVGGNGDDATDAQISLWHNVITVETDGEDWFTSIQTNKLHDSGAAWSTSDARYSKADFIQSAARVAAQSPGVMCEDEQSILYAISSPWYKMMDDDITRGSRDFAVAYVRVGVDGLIQSGAITTPEILKARTTYIPTGVDTAVAVRDKASGLMPACDLLYCGQGVILSRVREFTSQAVVMPQYGAFSWPVDNAPPLHRFNRVELWRSSDNGTTWAKLPAGNGLPDVLSVANIGIPSAIEARPGGAAKLAIPVRDKPSGAIKVSKSKDGGATWGNPLGGFPSIIHQPDANGGHGVDFFALRGGGFANNTDAAHLSNYSTQILHSYSGDNPPITTARVGTIVGGDISGTSIVNSLYPAYDKSLKEIVRVKIGSRDAPKDLVRPWIYDSAYEKPKEP